MSPRQGTAHERRECQGETRRLASVRVNSVGSASVLAVGLIGTLVTALLMMLPLYIGMSARQSVIAAADAAALAAADVAVGIIPGVPCEVAATVAIANTAVMTGCALDGVVVTVSTSRSILGLVLRAEATAGPPGSAAN